MSFKEKEISYKLPKPPENAGLYFRAFAYGVAISVIGKIVSEFPWTANKTYEMELISASTGFILTSGLSVYWGLDLIKRAFVESNVISVNIYFYTLGILIAANNLTALSIQYFID